MEIVCACGADTKRGTPEVPGRHRPWCPAGDAERAAPLRLLLADESQVHPGEVLTK